MVEELLHDLPGCIVIHPLVKIYLSVGQQLAMEDIERITIYNPKNIHFTQCLFLIDDLIDFILLYDYQPAIANYSVPK